MPSDGFTGRQSKRVGALVEQVKAKAGGGRISTLDIAADTEFSMNIVRLAIQTKLLAYEARSASNLQCVYDRRSDLPDGVLQKPETPDSRGLLFRPADGRVSAVNPGPVYVSERL